MIEGEAQKVVSQKRTMFWYYLGIGIISGATLLLEITMTRIFSVAFFNHFAFLIISTALFGFGFSGVFLFLFPLVKRFDFHKLLHLFSLGFALTIILTLKTVVSVPLQFRALPKESLQFLYLAVYYLALAAPFFFSGMVIALLLSYRPQRVNKLYFFDLVGGGIGCLTTLFLIPKVGASGAVIVAALLGLLSACCFGVLVSKKAVLTSLVIAIVLVVLFPFRESVIRVKVHEGKRQFNEHEQDYKIELTKWGPISRIDVADAGHRKVIWIDGGTNQSHMVPFNGDLESLVPDPRAGLVYQLVDSPNVLTVGPGGGEEVYRALTYGPRSITCVELDPVIVDLVQNEYREYIGEIYNKAMVKLICDEGRSYIRRCPRTFDIIQQINNASPVAIASGAVNLSETYLITVEAFHEYLDHLKPGGYLYIRRWGALRLATVAAQALRERGIEHPENQIVVLRERFHKLGGSEFYLKNGPFTAAEIALFRANAQDIIYCPQLVREKIAAQPIRVSSNSKDSTFLQKLPLKSARKTDPYHELIASEDGWKIFEQLGLNLFPVTDDAPFFNHFKKFGLLRPPDTSSELYPIFQAIYNTDVWLMAIYSSDIWLLAIVGEAAVLSFFFIIAPLIFVRRKNISWQSAVPVLLYFFSLGFGFILIEIVFIQKFTLFMGNPTFAVTVVLFALLISAGLGSYLSGRFQQKLMLSLASIVGGLVLIVWLEIGWTPTIFQLFISSSTPVRFLVASVLLFPMGMLMGMPFPLGITFTNRFSPQLIPWVWGINGYSTVVGSVTCVILAISYGFTVVLSVACVVYLAGFGALTMAKRI